MRNLFLTTVIALLAVGFVACEKEKIDNQAPVINLIAPAEDEAVKPGSDIHFDVEFTDNEALGSYKVNIHNAFDGHSHSRAAQAADAVAFEQTWTEAEFVKAGETPISGKRSAAVHHHKIVIPAQINGKPVKEGHYHFVVYCSDAAGNESFVAREIQISADAKEHSHH